MSVWEPPGSPSFELYFSSAHMQFWSGVRVLLPRNEIIGICLSPKGQEFKTTLGNVKLHTIS